MTWRSSDIHYGRRGGRFVDYRSPEPAEECRICGQPMLCGQVDTHRSCATADVSCEEPTP